MRGVRRFCSQDSGSVLTFVAVTIFLLAGMTILAVDISKLLVTRAQLQNAADAGALAGAERFLENPVPDQAAIEGRARTVAALNGAFNENRIDPVSNVSDITVTAYMDESDQANYGKVKVITRSVVSQYFTPLVALMKGGASTPSEGNVAALAIARAGAVCKVNCLKPFSIPDRWEDIGVTGWSQWANNEHWDHEKFVDGDTLNGVWDPGEKFFDGVDATTGGSPGKVTGAQDGQYSQEYYDPIETGYLASKDLGLELTFKPGSPSDVTTASHYYPIDLCLEDGQCTGADVYRWNIGNCNPTFYGVGDWVKTEDGNMAGPTKQGIQDLINSDPGAYWDDGCKCVRGSAFGDDSPRIAYVPLYDPRIPMDEGKTSIRIVKIVGIFFEQLHANGDVVGRFIKVELPGEQCPPGQSSGGFVYNLSLIK